MKHKKYNDETTDKYINASACALSIVHCAYMYIHAYIYI